MAKYRFKQGAGKHRMRVKNGQKVEHRLVQPGDVVELDEAQYAALSDKFEKGDALDDGPSSEELFRRAEAKKKEEDEAAAQAKAEAVAKAREAEAAALHAKEAEAKAGKAGADKKG